MNWEGQRGTETYASFEFPAHHAENKFKIADPGHVPLKSIDLNILHTTAIMLAQSLTWKLETFGDDILTWIRIAKDLASSFTTGVNEYASNGIITIWQNRPKLTINKQKIKRNITAKKENGASRSIL